MELKDLAGKHSFDAVDFVNERVPQWEGSEYFDDAQVCRFRLDGVVYAAIEDPSDGDRSSMRDLVVLNGVDLSNTFPSIPVVGIYHEHRRYEKCDVLELYDAENGKLVLTVGTENTDDYYPFFVASFSPENMSTNT